MACERDKTAEYRMNYTLEHSTLEYLKTELEVVNNIDDKSYELSKYDVNKLHKAVSNFERIEEEIKQFKDYEECLDY